MTPLKPILRSLWLSLMLTIWIQHPAKALSLDESEALLLRYHPLIQACNHNPEIAAALRLQDSAWNSPRLNMIAEDILGSPGSAKHNYTQWTLELQQDIPLSSYKQELNTLSKLEVEAAKLDCHLLSQTLRQNLQGLYLEALYWQEQQILAQEQLALTEALQAGLASQIAQGKRPGSEMMRFETEVTQARLLVSQARAELELRRRHLPLFWPQLLPKTEILLLEWPLAREPLPSLKTQIAKISHQVAQQELRATESNQIPDLTIGSGLRWHPQNQDMGLNLQLGWSIPNGTQYQAGLKARQLQAKQATQELAYTHYQILQQQAQLQENLRQKQSQQLVYQKELLPQASHYLEKVQRGLSLGKFTLLEVLEARRQTYTLKEDALKLRYEIAGLHQQVRELGSLESD